jgi:hypothetical protein
VEIARAVGLNGKALGIDISDQMVTLTHGLLKREGLAERTELTCGDAERLPYESNSLDGIFFMLAECKRVLRAGRLSGVQQVAQRRFHWLVVRWQGSVLDGPTCMAFVGNVRSPRDTRPSTGSTVTATSAVPGLVPSVTVVTVTWGCARFNSAGRGTGGRDSPPRTLASNRGSK